MTPAESTDSGRVADVDALAALLWQADRDASSSGAGFGASMAEDPCNYAYRSQARYILASDWLADVVAQAKAEERERIARAIEAERDSHFTATVRGCYLRAAAIARAATEATP